MSSSCLMRIRMDEEGEVIANSPGDTLSLLAGQALSQKKPTASRDFFFDSSHTDMIIGRSLTLSLSRLQNLKIPHP